MGSAETQGELWGAAARDWAILQEPKHEPLFEVMLDQANVTSKTRFLDAGCGGGSASVLAAKRGAHVSGLDAATAMIEIAQERVPKGDFRVGDIQELPFDDNSFDAVIAANSVQYSEDRVATLRELMRVTSEDGKVVVGLFGAPGTVQYRVIIDAVRDALPEPPPGNGPFELSESGALEDLIRRSGLKVQNSGEVACPFKYPDFETLWRVNVAAGPIQVALKSVGEEKLKMAIRDAAQPFRDVNRNMHFENSFLYVTATR
jgi:SAM-dependent methyltransferase